jgi:hypothetical protein
MGENLQSNHGTQNNRLDLSLHCPFNRTLRGTAHSFSTTDANEACTTSCHRAIPASTQPIVWLAATPALFGATNLAGKRQNSETDTNRCGQTDINDQDLLLLVSSEKSGT